MVRRLRKAMMKHLPMWCQEEQELVPGGDLRLAGNGWLRKAWDGCTRIKRVPRESEIRKVVYQIANMTDVCTLLSLHLLVDLGTVKVALLKSLKKLV